MTAIPFLTTRPATALQSSIAPPADSSAAVLVSLFRYIESNCLSIAIKCDSGVSEECQSPSKSFM